jgi:hypothetical protein
VKLAHAIGRVLESLKSRAGRRATFGTGVAVPFVFPLVGAGLLLLRVVAAATVGSWPPRAYHKASAARTVSAAVLWFPAPTASLMDGGRRMRKMAMKRSVSGETPGGRCWLSFPHENAGPEALHVHGESKQLEVRLPLAFSKLSEQNSFQKIERII